MGDRTIGAVAAVVALGLAVAGPARAQTCHPGQTDETTRPIPPALAPAVSAAFGVRMTPAEIERNGLVRCADGVLLACLVGANLNCGKADTRATNRAAEDWCHQHAGADFVPAFAAGHDTVYAWRCEGKRAAIAGTVQHADRQGFVAENWKRVEH